MVAANHSSTTFNPFVVETEQSKEISQELSENNKLRIFRRCANACEIITGTSLNSSIIFTFHLMQVHPIGLLLAMGTAHIYLTATALGEVDRRTTNIMTGASASLAILCSLHEPIGEWLQANRSKTEANIQIQELYHPTQKVELPWIEITAIFTIISLIILFGKKR